VRAERSIIHSKQTKICSKEPSAVTVYRDGVETALSKKKKKKKKKKKEESLLLIHFTRQVLEACQSKQISSTELHKQTTVKPGVDE